VRRFLRRLSRQDHRRPLVDPSQAQVRRRAARRPHPDERDRRRRAATCARSRRASRTSRCHGTCAEAVERLQGGGFDLVIVETSGIGQSDTEITEHADVALYVMTSEYGAATQLEKIDMLDFADVVAINKFDKRGSLDALRDVRKQFRRNHNLFDAKDEDLPVYGTIASQFNDPGMNALYQRLLAAISDKTSVDLRSRLELPLEREVTSGIMPPARVRYLAEIAESSDRYDAFTREQSARARRAYQIFGAIAALRGAVATQWDVLPELEVAEVDSPAVKDLALRYREEVERLDADVKKALRAFPTLVETFKKDVYRYNVRDKIIELPLFTESLSRTRVPKVSLPRFHDWGDILTWLLTENIPGEFPYAAGVFPLKREGEDPARMFAGEGGPERTNKRFHYVSRGMPAKRLSTAFDSVTSTARTPTSGPTSTARSATAASRSPTSTTRRSSTRASTCPTRRPASR
jgi:methylmalonyl-CoA mutase